MLVLRRKNYVGAKLLKYRGQTDGTAWRLSLCETAPAKLGIRRLDIIYILREVACRPQFALPRTSPKGRCTSRHPLSSFTFVAPTCECPRGGKLTREETNAQSGLLGRSNGQDKKHLARPAPCVDQSMRYPEMPVVGQ